METNKELAVAPSKNLDNNNTSIWKAIKVGACALILIALPIGCYIYENIHKKQVYENLNIDFTESKEIEYGTSNYNPLSLVDKSEGKIIKYTENVDTMQVGTKTLTFEVEKDNVVKKININIEVKDTVAPTINIKKDEIIINEGDTLNLQNNIESVNDIIDGNIEFSETEEPSHYTISSDLNNNKAGEYTANIEALDSNNNKSSTSFKIKVIAKPIIQEIQTNSEIQYENKPASIDTSSVISAAYSLLGSKYTYGGNNPSSGFDCSGFVQYVYGAVGKNISRSSGTQANDGIAVNKENMQAGDIIIWSTQSNNRPTHASLYVGNNKIIHAINSSRGVQTSDVTYWQNNGGGHIVAIRRI